MTMVEPIMFDGILLIQYILNNYDNSIIYRTILNFSNNNLKMIDFFLNNKGIYIDFLQFNAINIHLLSTEKTEIEFSTPFICYNGIKNYYSYLQYIYKVFENMNHINIYEELKEYGRLIISSINGFNIIEILNYIKYIG